MVPRDLMAATARPIAQLKTSRFASASSTSTPLKSLLRSKRGADEAELGNNSPSMSNSAKRARLVTFNPTVEMKEFSTEYVPPTLAEETRRYVRRALDEHIRPGGDDTKYDTLKDIFAKSTRTQGKEDNENMKAHLLALTSCVSLLGKNCDGLVKAVLNSEWVGRDETYARAFVSFLGNLASTQGSQVAGVLGILVNKFNGMRLTSGRITDCPDMSRVQLIGRVHMALKYLLRLIPSASGTLSPILRDRFPFSTDNTKKHMHYVNNLIRILDYAPELKGDIFSLITEKVVTIDVQMQVALDEVDDDELAHISQTLGLSADGNDSSDDSENSQSDSDNSDDDLDPGQLKRKHMQEHLAKLDSIMDTLFELYSPYFYQPDSTAAINMFDTLLNHFRNIILPTYRSRHTQFLLFHFAQSSEHLIDTFAGECVDLAFKSGRPAVLKQSAAAYLASFVSRGANVLPHVVRDVFNYIGVNLDIIRAENEVSCRGPDLQRYSTFYATTQALLYIFCFRWRDLIVSPSSSTVDEDGNEIAVEVDEEEYIGKDLEWRAGVKELLNRTIYSKLNPLKICAPAIVEEFAKTAKQLNFMYVYPLLATNKRIRLSQFALGAGNQQNGDLGLLRDTGFGTEGGAETESWHQLDAYFPFDPYHLPKSRRWVDGEYKAWEGVPGMQEEYEDETEDETAGETEADSESENEFDETEDDDGVSGSDTETDGEEDTVLESRERR